MSDVILDIAAIKARAEAATSGPWAVGHYDLHIYAPSEKLDDDTEGLIDRLAEDYAEAARVAEDSRDRSLWGLVERRLLPVLDYLEPSPTPASRMEARHG